MHPVELQRRIDNLDAGGLLPGNLQVSVTNTLDEIQLGVLRLGSVRASINPRLGIEGLVRTMYDGRNNLATAVSDELIANFGDRVYRTLVPRNVRVAEAPSYGLPVLVYDPRSKGALAHVALAGEMLRRHEKRHIA